MTDKGKILIYQTDDLTIKVDVRIEDDTVWLSQAQIAELFGKAKSTINEHIKNIYQEKELLESQTLHKFGNTEFMQKGENYYNLEMIIAVGYRVKSTQGTQFRIWAQRLDAIVQVNGRELLTHAGKISHQLAMEKSNQEFEKYQTQQN